MPGSELCYSHRGVMKHCTAGEMELRIAEVIRCISTGGERRDVLQLAARRWGLSIRSTDDLLARAYGVLKSELAAPIEEHRAKAIARLTTIQSLAMSDRQYGPAVGAQRELTKILGLNAPDALELTGSLTVVPRDVSLVDLSDDELRELVEA